MYVLATKSAKLILGTMIVVMALLASVAMSGGSAHAQANCETRASLIAKLDKGFGEQPIAIGLVSTGNVIEVLSSASGSWTILITHPDGMSCIAAAGEYWQTLKKLKLPGQTS